MISTSLFLTKLSVPQRQIRHWTMQHQPPRPPQPPPPPPLLITPHQPAQIHLQTQRQRSPRRITHQNHILTLKPQPLHHIHPRRQRILQRRGEPSRVRRGFTKIHPPTRAARSVDIPSTRGVLGVRDRSGSLHRRRRGSSVRWGIGRVPSRYRRGRFLVLRR